jgi:hypothetical protein
MTIIGYTFNADCYCPDCIIGAYNGNSDDYDAEAMLTILASARGIERGDEYSFDSGDFPKVIFSHQFEGEICGKCSRPLID